jgi:GntR family transcriptional regulator, transcriptional repressor for pyruvate dehydrogenase complex
MEQRTKRYIRIAEQIRSSIYEGEFQPGGKLPSERELARRYEAGRSSIREALTILQGMGLIEVRQGYGARVLFGTDQASSSAGAQPSDNEILEARAIIECQNLQLAVQRATRADMARLAELLWTLEAELKQGQLGLETDLQFQLALAAAAHNHLLYHLSSTMIHYIRQTLSPEWRLLKQQRAYQERLVDQYRSIFRAIAAGNAQRAVMVMQEHLRYLGDELGRQRASAAQDASSVVVFSP